MYNKNAPHRAGGIYYSAPYWPIRKLWYELRKRHYNKNIDRYKYYGGKGCKICTEWETFEPFCKWCLSNGWAPGLHLDKDIKGNGFLYSPDTCCFVTPYINSVNRSITKKFFYKGENLSLSEISKKVNIPYSILKCRVVSRKLDIVTAINMGQNKRPDLANRKKSPRP